MDDLIFSGAGSGCRGDDEDECTPPFESGSGDDLITPVYIPPTKQPSEKPSKKPEPGDKTCDDEDCLHGSGSGETTEVLTSTTGKGELIKKSFLKHFFPQRWHCLAL
jgi:neurexin